jgi:hypothetical protein
MSGLMNRLARRIHTPISSRPLRSEVSHAVWYPCHEGSGSELQCKLGNGPTLTSGAAITTEWGTWGALTPIGASPGHWRSPTANTYLQQLCSFANMNGQELLVGYGVEHDGAMTASETLFSWGRQDSAAASNGGWRLLLAAVRQHQWQTFTGNGQSGGVLSGLPNSATTSTSKRLCVMQIQFTSNTVCNVNFRQFEPGVGLGTAGSVVGHNLSGGGGANSVPTFDASSRFVVAARQAGSVSYDQYGGAAAGSNLKLSNIWVAKITTPVAGLAESCLDDMAAAPQDFPKTLRW